MFPPAGVFLYQMGRAIMPKSQAAQQKCLGNSFDPSWGTGEDAEKTCLIRGIVRQLALLSNNQIPVTGWRFYATLYLYSEQHQNVSTIITHSVRVRRT